MITVKNIDINKFNSLVEENQTLQDRIQQLTRQLEWFKRQMFGQKSERLIDNSENHPELPGLDVLIDSAPPAEEISIPSHVRRKNGAGKGENILTIPDHIPREEIVHELKGPALICPKTGKQMVEIGREVVEKLARRDGDYFVKKHVYIKYGVPGEPLSGVIQAPAPTCILTGSKFDVSFMADLVVEKYGFHLPLNRVQERMDGFGIGVSRQALSSLIVNLGDKVIPLYDLMARKVIESGVIFTDDTPVKLIIKGRGKAKQAHIWIYLGGKPNAPPYHVYEFSENRKHEHPENFLKNFTGTIHADAYEVYENLDAGREDFVWAACWAHARRKFKDALGGGKSEFILCVLRIMKYLFMYERVAWNRSQEERLAVRNEKEKPLIDRLFAMMNERVVQGDLIPKSGLAEAIGYMLSRKKQFQVYLDDPDIRMHNNPAEAALRKVVIGRKNWLFIGSPKAGKSAAALLSLVQTCRAMKINPREYLEDLFTRLLDHPAKRLGEFLPDQWLAAKDRETENKKSSN